jgi:hypothetical protein
MRLVLDEQMDLEATERRHLHLDVAAAWVRYPAPGPWVLEAACAGMDVSAFVNPLNADAAARARAVCADCPVLADCDDYALTAHTWGVWGGQLRRGGNPQPRAG